MASVRLKRSSKFWYACITGGDGRQRQFSTGLEDREEAYAVAVAAERAARRLHEKPHQLRAALDRLAAEFIPAADADPAIWLPAWAAAQKSRVAPATAALYASTMKSAAAFFAAGKITAFSAILPRHIEALRDAWNAETSAATANVKLKVFRVALAAACRPPHRLMAENPATSVSYLRAGETSRREFRPAEWQALLAVLHGEWKAMVLLSLNAGGQRLNDVAELRHKHIDLAERAAHFIARKTGRVVSVPLIPATLDALAELDSSDDPEAFVFPGVAALARTSRSNQFRTILASVGLARPVSHSRKAGPETKSRAANELSFHSLRHTATSWLKSAGVSDGIVRAIVGHESAAVSRRYTHLDHETIRAALEKMPV